MRAQGHSAAGPERGATGTQCGIAGIVRHVRQSGTGGYGHMTTAEYSLREAIWVRLACGLVTAGWARIALELMEV